jgi:hypothetical protein
MVSLAALLGITRRYVHMLEAGVQTMGPALAARFYILAGAKPISGLDGDGDDGQNSIARQRCGAGGTRRRHHAD